MDADDRAGARGTEKAAPAAAPTAMETTSSAGAVLATIDIEKREKTDPLPLPPQSSSLAPPCLAAVRAESAALAREEAERAAVAAADAARWDPEAWASTADKVLLPFVRTNRSGALERALQERPAPSVSPPPPLAPPPPAIASVGDVVIVAAESPDDLSVLRVAPSQAAEEAARGGGSGSGDGAAAAAVASTSAAALPLPPPPSTSSSRWSGDPSRGNSQACWVGTVRQLEAASGRALLGWLAPKRTKKSGTSGIGGSSSVGGSVGDEPPLLSPPPSSPAAAPSDDAPPPSTSGSRGGNDPAAEQQQAEQQEEEDFSRSAWVPAPGLPADWLDAASVGILAVCRSLERGTAAIPAAALAGARARLRALVAHDEAQAERARRKAAAGGQQ